jgi:hypothetical protein
MRLTTFALLLQVGPSVTADNAAGGSMAVATGGAVPDNGFAIYNPDASNDLWGSDSAAASANG